VNAPVELDVIRGELVEPNMEGGDQGVRCRKGFRRSGSNPLRASLQASRGVSNQLAMLLIQCDP